MDIILLKKHLLEYQTFVNKKNKTIGSIIRHYRRQQKLTLEETSEDICSISYLCKVENNQLVPSETILAKLIQRLNIREEEINYNQNLNWTEEILLNGKVSKELYDIYKTQNTYQAKLVMYSYKVLNENDFKGSYKQYLELTDYFPHFIENELHYFIYLTMYVFYKTERYYDAMALYKELDVHNQLTWLNISANIILMKSLYKLNLVSEVNINYPIIMQKLMDFNKIDEMIKIRNYNLAFKAKIIDSDDLDLLLEHISKDETILRDYVWFNHYFFKMRNYEKALTYIRNIYFKSSHYYVMYLITLDITKKEAELTRILSEASLFKMKDSYELVKNYLIVKYFQKNHIKYLKEQLITAKFMTEEVAISDYLLNESHQLFKNGYYYKDTVKILEHQNRILREKLKFYL